MGQSFWMLSLWWLQLSIMLENPSSVGSCLYLCIEKLSLVKWDFVFFPKTGDLFFLGGDNVSWNCNHVSVVNNWLSSSSSQTFNTWPDLVALVIGVCVDLYSRSVVTFPALSFYSTLSFSIYVLPHLSFPSFKIHYTQWAFVIGSLVITLLKFSLSLQPLGKSAVLYTRSASAE